MLPMNATAPRPSTVRRIAVFRALQLGDMLCAVPALRALRQAFPHAHVALVGLPWARAFVERYPMLIDELIVFPGAPGMPEQPQHDDAGAIRHFCARMRARRFDLALQLHGSGELTNAIVHAFDARRCAGFVRSGRRPPPGMQPAAWDDAQAEPLRCLALLRTLGVADDADEIRAVPWIPLSPSDFAACDALLAAHRLTPGRLVLIHPGAQLPSRRWPAERFARVADALARRGWQIAVTGTAAEVAITAAVLGAMSAPAAHLAGRTSLGTLTALVRRARLLVCNDTAVSHVAAAMRTRSVVIASGSDTRRWAPADRARHRVLADWPACRPCAYRDCPVGHVCALNVGVDAALRAALAQLDHTDHRHAA